MNAYATDDFVAMTGFVSKAAATVSSVISDLKVMLLTE